MQTAESASPRMVQGDRADDSRCPRGGSVRCIDQSVRDRRQPVSSGTAGLSQVPGKEADRTSGESSQGIGSGELRRQLRSRWVNHRLESKPLLSFAVYYVTAHLALGLVDEKRAEAILNYCEEHLEE